jgi:hypothetical protein
MPTTIQEGEVVFTFADAVEATLDAFDLERTPLGERRARASVLQAYRDLPSRHSFRYYTRRRLLQTVASYSTGTVVFDYTGGANELELTLTGGTWPSWAQYGRVIIGDVHYDVDKRVSSTVLTLSESSNPGADVASTDFTIYRSSYPLPVGFKEFVRNGLWERSQEYPIPFYTPDIVNQALQSVLDAPSTPEHATVQASGKYFGGKEIVFGPPPDTIYTYDMLYVARPRPLQIDEYSNATVSLSGATVTGASGVTFPANCEGSLIRFSSNTTKPSSLVGGINCGDNPYVAHGLILSRDSSTQLTLTESPGQTLTSVGYTISDPLDIDTNVMLTAFLRAAETEYARLQGREDYRGKMAVARQALLEAMEADQAVDGSYGFIGWNPFVRTTSEDVS